MDITSIISKELNIGRWQAEAVIRLIDEGNTIPFIARYRKEAHGNLNDEQLRAFDERLTYLRNLEERKTTVLTSIENQGKLTDALRKAIDDAQTQTTLEDLYRPFRPKRRTRAMIAREAGLEPLAAYILSEKTPRPVEEEAARYVHAGSGRKDAGRPEEKNISGSVRKSADSDGKENIAGSAQRNARQGAEKISSSPDIMGEIPAVPDVQTAIQMAEDIIAEQVSDNAAYRDWIRKEIWKDGLLFSTKAAGKGNAAAGQKAARSETSGKKSAGHKSAEQKSVEHNKKLEGREEVYENYFDYSEPLSKVPGHRILAIDRGEKEKFLSVHIEAPAEKIIEYLYRQLNMRESSNSASNSAKSKRKPIAGNPFANIVIEPVSNGGQTDHRSPKSAAYGNDDRHKVFRENPVTSQYIREAVTDAWKRLIGPSMDTQIRNDLTDRAQEGAMKVFASNLEQLLMQPPITGKVVLGWDPAFRTGCKLAVVDETGKVLETTVIFPTEPQNKVAQAKQTLRQLYDKYHYTLISCGNGTASRESEQIIADFIRETKLPIQYVITNEAGASVYSASALATEEFPNFDVGQRSATSIARRVQDPLAELVKIDPKSIGVGQYQHDMNQTKLGQTLTGVVEDCVNRVGVDVNTASAALLSYISGLNKSTAKNVVAWREQNGRFTNRRDLLQVKGLGAKAFEQCAGFLRIRNGDEPLDQTAVHPESYAAAGKLLSALGYTQEDIKEGRTGDIGKRAERYAGRKNAAAGGSQAAVPTGAVSKGHSAGKAALAGGLSQLCLETGLGEFTLKDVITELEKPGRDPRTEVAGPVLRSDVLSMKDLKPGMILKGTVRNIVDFGAFVDIGVHQDGLVHISQLSNSYVKHPLDVVKVGDIVTVKVLAVDETRSRISLSMKDV